MAGDIILDALKIERRSANAYITNVGREHRFGEFLHGGFAASLIVYTALEHVRTTLERTKPQQVTSLQVQYLKPVAKGEIELKVEQPRVTKTNATLHVALGQKGAACVTGYVSLVDAAAHRGITIDISFKLDPEPAPVDLAKLDKNEDPNWIIYHLPYTKTGQGQPLAHWNLGMTRANPVNPRVHDMWYTLYDSSKRITTIMLPLIADFYLRMVDNFIPHSDFSYEACLKRAQRSVNGDIRQEDLDKAVSRYWTATQSLSLEIIKQLPEEGVKWVLLRAEAKAVQNGRLIVEMTMMDEQMNLVAYGKGVDMLIPAQRWVEENRREGSGARIMKM